MMRYGYDPVFVGGNGIICTLIALVILVDLILVGVWLWKQISK